MDAVCGHEEAKQEGDHENGAASFGPRGLDDDCQERLFASEGRRQVLDAVDEGDAHCEPCDEAHADGREERKRDSPFRPGALLGDVNGSIEAGVEVCTQWTSARA